MRLAPIRRLAVVALALLWWGTPDVCGQVPDQLLGREVRETRLRSGGQAVQDAQLEGLVEIRRGQPLAMGAVRETIVHLMGMGRYIDIQVSAFADGDGVRVDIDLVPLPQVRRFAFTGDLGLPERTLRAAVEERFGASPASSRAPDIARALKERLADDGYLRASVDVRPNEPAAAGADTVFHVTCGPRAVVGTVSYRADDPADARDIQSRVPLRSGTFFDRVELRRRLGAAEERWRAKRYYEARADYTLEESDARRVGGRPHHVRPRPARDGVGQGPCPHAQAARRLRARGARRVDRRRPARGLRGAD